MLQSIPLIVKDIILIVVLLILLAVFVTAISDIRLMIRTRRNRIQMQELENSNIIPFEKKCPATGTNLLAIRIVQKTPAAAAEDTPAMVAIFPKAQGKVVTIGKIINKHPRRRLRVKKRQFLSKTSNL
jgi:O-phosphoseryl-tRNA(Cys) synthetase